MKTTFWMDFSIADAFGEEAIRDTFNRGFGALKRDHVYLTELVMVLNHKIWQWWEKDKEHPYVRLYDELWRKADGYAVENLKGDELRYFLQKTD